MRIAVTGATGHVGVNVVDALVARGDRVRVVVRGPAHVLGDRPVERAHADVTDPDALARAFAGCDVVIHLAAHISITGSQRGLVERVNVEGAGNSARASAACGVPRHLHMSSVHAFDPAIQPITEHSPPARADQPAYDRSKAAGERAVYAARPDAVVLNPVGVIGPLDPAPSRVGTLLLRLFRGWMPAVVHGGFSWVDVRDVTGAVLTAIEAGRPGERYLLGGHTHTMAELARMAAHASGRWTRPALPMWVARALASPLEALSGAVGAEPLWTHEALDALATHTVASHARAAADLAFHPRPIAQTITDLYAAFRADGRL